MVATVALLSAGAAAAAATGHLPDPLQRTVSHTFSHVGVDLPSPEDGTDTPTDVATTTTVTGASDTTTPTSTAHEAVGPDATGAAKTGLCTAYVANDGHGNSRDAVAFKNLTDAATNAGQSVAEFCAPTTDTTTTTTTTGEAATPTQPGNSGSTPAATAPGKPTEPGNSGSTPAATEPGKPTEPGKSGSTPPPPHRVTLDLTRATDTTDRDHNRFLVCRAKPVVQNSSLDPLPR